MLNYHRGKFLNSVVEIQGFKVTNFFFNLSLLNKKVKKIINIAAIDSGLFKSSHVCAVLKV